MAKIYISSTSEDLKKERETAAKAIQRLDHQAIGMENYVASDKCPLDKCLEDIRSCHAYVGIFAWRYGFIPDGYDKSITHLEYEEAKNANIPCLIFLLEEEVSWPPKYISTGKERIERDRFREQLKKEKMVSFFKNADELSGLVSVAVANEIPSILSKNKSKLRTGASMMLNRIPQINDFMKFFLEKSVNCPKRPQFYFIHGNEWEGHDCLLERLMKTCLKEFAEKEWGKESATICRYEVPWPKKGHLSKRQEDLRMNFQTKFSQYHGVTDFTVNTLSHLPCFDKHPLVLIKHNIYSSKWDKNTEPLIAWYIKEFWDALEVDIHAENPLFLVFFNVKYKQPKKTGLKWQLFQWRKHTKEHINEQLLDLCQSSDNNCPCQLIEELTPIEIEDVQDWLSEFNVIENEWERKQVIDSIFIENDIRVTSKCWAKIEDELSNILEKYQFQQEEMI